LRTFVKENVISYIVQYPNIGITQSTLHCTS